MNFLFFTTLIIAIIIWYLLRSKEPVPEKYQSITFENEFKVTEIIDGDTFRITPGWKWNGKTGTAIRPMGYDTPKKGEPGFNITTTKLKELLLNKEVELKNPIKLSYDRLLCDVYFENKNLADFFPKYLARKIIEEVHHV
jgi:endonuclease YncB( thermonuclease family)